MIPIRSGRISNQTGSLRADLVSKQEHLEVRVAACRLDDEPVGDVGFLKIDVEGFERAVIEGALETIRRCKPVMLVEIE